MTVEQATPRRRWRPRFSLLTLVLVVVLAGSGLGLWLRWDSWVPIQVFEQEGTQLRVRFAHDGRSLLTYSAVFGDEKKRTRYLGVWDLPEGRKRFAVPLQYDPGKFDFGQVEFSPDDCWILLTGGGVNHGDYVCWVVSALTGAELQLGGGASWPQNCAVFSQDGRYLAYGKSGYPYFYRVEAEPKASLRLKFLRGTRDECIKLDGDYLDKCAFLLNGRRLLVSALGVQVKLYDTLSLKAIPLELPVDDSYTPQDFLASPDGRQFATGSLPGLLMDAESGRLVADLRYPPGGLKADDGETGDQVNYMQPDVCVAFSPDGSLMAFPWGCKTRVVDTLTGEILPFLVDGLA